MYMPPAFEEQRLDELHALIRHEPLGVLVTAARGLAADHVPFTLVAEAGSHGLGLLRAHLARGNEQARAAAGPIEALVIFSGVEHYVTPSWYETKRRTGKVVPTWNYVAVHASGPLRIIDDAAWVRSQIDALTREHEGRRAAPWAVTDAPPDFVAAQLRGIVGIEIDIARLQGKWKLSQNRAPEDHRGVVAGLEREGEPEARAMARLMGAADGA